ncbi:MAG TPA: RnfH family protein, partial [Sulfuricaulis sp.]|nr:RnfH family protein [Sulfuricaulis sp.]
MKPETGWRVEVAYAAPARQEVIELTVRPGASVEQVIRESGLLERFPEIDLARNRVGIFGEIAGLRDPVRDGDRVEIYRTLLADPKETRRRRAARRAKR